MSKTPRSQRVEAIVLRHSDWGEADRLLVIFTRQSGKMRVIAKGVRRVRSRKAGHLEPFTRVTLMLAAGRDLWIITQAEMVDAYLTLREDLLLTTYAAYVVELLDRFIIENGENPSLYTFLSETLQRLDQGADTFLTLRYYELHLLDFMGFRPELFHCVRCHKEIQPEAQYFSAEMGGALCPACGRSVVSKPVGMVALRYLRHLQRSSFMDAARAKMTSEQQQEVEQLLQYYLTYLLERKINSSGFLDQIRA